MSDKHYSREAFRAHQELARKIETTYPCQSYLSVSLPPQKVVLFDIDQQERGLKHHYPDWELELVLKRSNRR